VQLFLPLVDVFSLFSYEPCCQHYYVTLLIETETREKVGANRGKRERVTRPIGSRLGEIKVANFCSDLESFPSFTFPTGDLMADAPPSEPVTTSGSLRGKPPPPTPGVVGSTSQRIRSSRTYKAASGAWRWKGVLLTGTALTYAVLSYVLYYSLSLLSISSLKVD